VGNAKSTVFWEVMPCTPIEVYQHCEGMPPSSSLKPRKQQGYSASSLTLMMEAVHYFEMSVNSYNSIQHHMPEVSTHHKLEFA
jgi:hypothetical protein